MKCTHWGVKFEWIKESYGCIPCLPKWQREWAFNKLPQSVRHLLGPNCLEPWEVLPKQVERPDRVLKQPHEYTREHEKHARRKAIVDYMWAKPKRECARIELCAALKIHPQTLSTDFTALRSAGVLRLSRVEGVHKIYQCIKLV